MLFCELMKNHYYNDAINKKNPEEIKEKWMYLLLDAWANKALFLFLKKHDIQT